MIVDKFAAKKDEVVAAAVAATIGPDLIPFLPVIPRTVIPVKKQIVLVHFNGKEGFTHLDEEEITDHVQTPEDPYYTLIIEDGRIMCGESVKNAEKHIIEQTRSPFTATEVVSLGVHTNVLAHHYVDAAGSRCEGGDRAPSLYPDDDGPELGWDNVGYGYDGWGSASCNSSRI